VKSTTDFVKARLAEFGWIIIPDCNADYFIILMVSLGKPVGMALVGAFDEEGRGSRRDTDLPMHRDGVYSAQLAKVQGGFYVEQPGIDFVGLYCICDSEERCVTLVGDQEIEMKGGQVLIFDNNRYLHGRRGPVGSRLLIRMWIQKVPEEKTNATKE